jgi:hypothetical protein
MPQITFGKGVVASLGYRPLSSEEPGAPGWVIDAQVKDVGAGWLTYQDMEGEAENGLECLSTQYDFTTYRVSIEVATEEHRDAWLAWAIRYLREAGHLDRDQELTAYVSFGLPYH